MIRLKKKKKEISAVPRQWDILPREVTELFLIRWLRDTNVSIIPGFKTLARLGAWEML